METKKPLCQSKFEEHGLSHLWPIITGEVTSDVNVGQVIWDNKKKFPDICESWEHVYNSALEEACNHNNYRTAYDLKVKLYELAEKEDMYTFYSNPYPGSETFLKTVNVYMFLMSYYWQVTETKWTLFMCGYGQMLPSDLLKIIPDQNPNKGAIVDLLQQCDRAMTGYGQIPYCEPTYPRGYSEDAHQRIFSAEEDCRSGIAQIWMFEDFKSLTSNGALKNCRLYDVMALSYYKSKEMPEAPYVDEVGRRLYVCKYTNTHGDMPTWVPKTAYIDTIRGITKCIEVPTCHMEAQLQTHMLGVFTKYARYQNLVGKLTGFMRNHFPSLYITNFDSLRRSMKTGHIRPC